MILADLLARVVEHSRRRAVPIVSAGFTTGAGRRPRSAAFLPVVATLAAALAILRRPDAIFRPEFWAEDGALWWQDAYNHGWASLAEVTAGYYQTLSRLVGVMAQYFDLRDAPLLFASVALLMQCLPAVFLLSRRMDGVCPSLEARCLLALLYIAVPNSAEENLNLTNAQWHLALLAFLVIVAARPKTRWQWAFDVATLTLSGLSGPFGILMIPACLLQIRRVADRASWVRAAIVVASSCVQTVSLFSEGARSIGPLGASVAVGARIIGGQVILPPLLGDFAAQHVSASHVWAMTTWPIAVVVAAVALGGVTLRGRRLDDPYLSFLGFCTLVIGTAMVWPLVSMTSPQWPLMELIGAGQRYYLFPMLAWLCVIVALAGDRNRVLRIVGVVAVVAALIADAKSFRYEDVPGKNFAVAARRFDAAAIGETVQIDVAPGNFTPIRVVKH